MIRWSFPVLFVLLSISAAMAKPIDAGRQDQEAAKNGWIFDLDDGVTQAKENGKPLMVVLRCEL